MSFIGINIGALAVKAVALRGNTTTAVIAPHQGQPLEVLRHLLAGPQFADAEFFAVSGSLGHVTEVAAIQRALHESGDAFDAVVSLGGEAFLVYLLADGRIANVLSHNKCAAGSGEFFIQQIGRMGLGLEEAIRRSFAGKVVPLASRCSVHCKSDITHKLNRHEAATEDILHTLHDSMAGKVIALIEKGPRKLGRVLLIGGVVQNAALVAALRGKRPGVEFVVRPESAWFEAWGSALLARDKPHHRQPHTTVRPRLDRLPPLGSFAAQVRVIASPGPQAAPAGPLVLGVDAGSTTTKIVLLDPATRGLVAFHYLRTNGDPLAAIRQCLRAVAAENGNLPVGLIATTGSARELAGAYLGTAHVHNEISAHAAGATHYDPGVDTIFEIGGQDSKYIFLRHGVPIDYTMNNACSAGTGSFLEESAHGDLGIEVGDIAALALAAPSPVLFKTTCAAFINSDIRIAQQQGCSREDIVAGLVYAIAGNYLNRVKGPRPVGAKVFLQGGVALNAAVAHAFAHSTGSPVVIPPHPELLGALGVALLALARAGGVDGSARGLLALAGQEMKHAGRFTCRACRMYCGIDRFVVDRRRFPFGGRCSLFERSWQRRARTVVIPDLVEQRAALLFRPLPVPAPAAAPSAASPARWDFGPTIAAAKTFLEDRFGRDATSVPSGRVTPRRIGLPRALTTHSLHPLYSGFFAGLGMEVILSGIDTEGDTKSNSGFCFPAQIAHGAVLDLARKNVELVFLPHVTRMPHPSACRDSLLCPITQASPYFLAKAFPGIRILSPVLDFTQGYGGCTTLVELVERELGVPRAVAEPAWGAAVRAQLEAERAMQELGRSALAEALASGQPALLLAGHSYNAFTPEASQSVGRKLASMGIWAIPADCLGMADMGPTAWHFANQIMNAVALAKQHPNLFLLCVSNFSCTIDAFTHAMLAAELGAKPYLLLEIDAATADAGVQTRLEAFLDIIRNYRAAAAVRRPSFTPARLVGQGVVICSSGERVPLTDPRVKLYLPNFSSYHTQALGLAMHCLGLHPGTVVPLTRTQLERGLRYTSGRECLPLPLCIGQILQIHERRAPGEIVGFYTARGGAPCVSDAYLGYFERFVAEQQLSDLFLLNASAENDYLGFSGETLARHVGTAIVLADILVEIDHVLRVVGATGSGRRFRKEWLRFAATVDSLDEFNSRLPALIRRIAALPRTREPQTCPRVVVTGDFFTRFSPFFMEGVRDLYTERGIILKPVDLADLMLYGAYDGIAGAADAWGMKPGNLAFAKACTRILQPDGKEYLQRWLMYQAQRRVEQYYRDVFAESGLLVASSNDVAELFERAAEHVSPTIFGEAIPAVGKGVGAAEEGYDGTLLIGPFNCLPFRIAEAILRPLSLQHGVPVLTYESDGCAVTPAFLRQVEVHIEQVLDFARRRRAAHTDRPTALAAK
ncbi:MAG: acyl-CoA dehydratase activase [Opitutaceae bacterium]|nr:acyl-CoA dehydratase activase [Opitutaceae bacterium]